VALAFCEDAPTLSAMDKGRDRYLVAYDICDPRRLARVHRYLNGYKVGGQKSVYEVWATPAEIATIITTLRKLIDAEVDRVHLFRLDPRMSMHAYGIPVESFPSYFVVA